jgi:hypothetical protein
MRSLHVVALTCLLGVVALRAHAADEPDELVPGRIVIIKNAKLAKFVAKPPTGTSFDLPDTTNDPTTEGGLLEVFDNDPFRPVSADFALPATGWKGLGNPAGSKGFKYTGAGSVSDPCRVVLVKAAVVKSVCKGGGVTLPTPFLGQVGIVLTVGTDSKRYCAVFGGDDTKNDATALKRKNAPAPGACPLDLNSSTTIPPTTSTTTTSSTTTTDSVPAPSTTTTASPVSSSTSTTNFQVCGPMGAGICGGYCVVGTCLLDGADCVCFTTTTVSVTTTTSSTTTSTILVPCGDAAAPSCLGGECPVPGMHCVYDGDAACTCIFTTTTTM